jgi:adenylate cyclase
MSATPEPTATHVVRALEARRNEELVRAHAALLGERRIAWVRIAMYATFALTQEVVGRLLGRAPAFDGPRTIGVILYGVFAFASLVALYRAQPNVRRAVLIPFITSVVDFGFLAFQGTRSTHVEGQVFPEMGAISMGLVLCFSVARYGTWHVAWSTLLAIVAYGTVLYTTGTFEPPSSPFVLGGFVALGFLIALTNRAVHSMFAELRRRDNLSRFLPQQVVDRVLAAGEDALRPVQCEVTVLFSDLRDFTTFSESLAPRDVLRFLDDYFGHMVQVVKGHEGVVGKFLGDGMLAFWGVPDRNPAHAELAIRAALDMRRRLDEINARRERDGLQPVRFGVGIHTGLVAAGMLGGADQHEYTIIGDAVNVASRIEGLTKSLGHDVLARFHGARVAEEHVKGRQDPVVVYSLEGAA